MDRFESPLEELFGSQRSAAKSFEIALLMEELCRCSLADDQAGVTSYSTLLRRVLAKRSQALN